MVTSAIVGTVRMLLFVLRTMGNFGSPRLVKCAQALDSGTPGMTGGVELIRGMALGDRDAFARFYDRYASLVYPVVLNIVRDAADAADVVQEVFWESWQNAAAYDPARGSAEAWLFTRARTRALDRLRAVRRRGTTFVGPVDEAVAAVEPLPDAAALAENRSVVLRALAQLPEPQREVIALAYYRGLTQTEIAARTRQPLGTVKTRLRLALERLREVVKRP
jgi:RNA polymerase sigma-70 factor (ECF subfamily)